MAAGSEHQQFGMEGIRRTLDACRQQSLPDTLDALFRESQAFTLGEGRHDDTSVLLLERRREG